MVTKSERSRKGLSEQETKLLTELASKNKKIINIKDIQKELQTNYNNAKKTASDLKKKGWLERLQKGKYLIIPLEAGEKPQYTEHEFIITSKLTDNYYIGFLSALNFHGMTEQTPMQVFVATKKRKRNQEIHGIKYNYITLNKNKFFGYQNYSLQNTKIKISNKEKTITDCLDLPKYSGGIEEITKGLRTDLNLEKLVEYVTRIGNGAAVKRLHYLLHTLKINLPKKLENKLKENYSKSYSLLDPTKPNKGKHSSKWKLRLNVPKETILGDEY